MEKTFKANKKRTNLWIKSISKVCQRIFLIVISLVTMASSFVFVSKAENTDISINFGDLAVSGSGGWYAGAKFTLDGADGNWGQSPAGTWTSIVERNSSKQLKFELKATNATKMLRFDRPDTFDKYTFSFDYKFDFASITAGQVSIVPVLGLQKGTAYNSRAIMPELVMSTNGTTVYHLSKKNMKPYATDNISEGTAVLSKEKHTVTATFDGGVVKIYIDAILVQSFTSTSYTSGDVGILLYGYNNVGGGTVYLDNITLKNGVIVPTSDKSIDFEDLAVSGSGGWDAGAKFTLDGADGNWGQDPNGTWTSIVERNSSKQLKFELRQKMLQKCYDLIVQIHLINILFLLIMNLTLQV